jgi:pimeloyl-ACP methyl ester carboxylesterase
MSDAPLVFVHGIKGGTLAAPSGAVRWIGWAAALGLDRRPLRSPLSWSGGVQDPDGMVAQGPLERVLGVPVYARFLGWARTNASEFRALAYDWRRDLPEAVTGLTGLLDELAARHGRPARVIGHSMGGLIAWLALRERPELASGVLFAAVPFGAGISFGHVMHHGERLGLNRRLAGVEAHCSWVAPYCFFPAHASQIEDAAGRPVEHDWYDPAAWERQRLGPFGRPDQDPAAWRAHLAEALACARRTRALLDQPHPAAERLPPLAVLSGVGRRAVQVAIRSGPDARPSWDFTSGRADDGDGSVAAKRSFPPGGLDVLSATTRLRHQAVLGDLETVGALMDGLRSRGA